MFTLFWYRVSRSHESFWSLIFLNEFFNVINSVLGSFAILISTGSHNGLLTDSHLIMNIKLLFQFCNMIYSLHFLYIFMYIYIYVCVCYIELRHVENGMCCSLAMIDIYVMNVYFQLNSIFVISAYLNTHYSTSNTILSFIWYQTGIAIIHTVLDGNKHNVCGCTYHIIHPEARSRTYTWLYR